MGHVGMPLSGTLRTVPPNRRSGAGRSDSLDAGTSAPTLTRRQEQGEQSRKNIIASASELFARHGYVGTPMSRLSQHCGLPPSSIYWHFGSKAGVLNAVIEHNVEQFVTGLPRMSEFEGTPLERLEQMVDVIAASLERGEAPTRLIILLSLEETGSFDSTDASEVEAELARVRELMLDLWREAIGEVIGSTKKRADRELIEQLARLGRAAAIGAFVTDRPSHAGDLRTTLDTFTKAVAAIAATRRAN